MKKLILSAALLAGGAASTLSLSSAAPVGGVTIAFSKDVYLPGEHAFLTVTGAPGTIVWLGFDPDAGPTTIPGLGTFDLGFSQNFLFAQLAPLPPSGSVTIEWFCEDPCHDVGVSLNVQGIALDPVTMAFSITNSEVLDIQDLYGFCGSTGCTPGYWKTHPEAWGPTGLSPDDDFDTTFGVNAFKPNLTLMEALDPTNPLSTFASHAVAALLNSLHPDEDYALEPSEVIDYVQEAIADGSTEKLIEIKDIFAHLNEAGCPF